MKRVLFINSAIYLPGEGGYKRSLYLFDLMKSLHYDVTLLTSDFNHYSKEKRDIEKFYKEYPNYKDVVMLSVPNYKKNISLKRYFSMIVFAKSVKTWVKSNINNYDVVYVCMPGAGVVKKTSRLCKKYKKPLIIDVRDLFPEALNVVIKNKFLYNVLTYPFKLSADRAYSCADELVAVSKEYLDRALRVNKKSINPKVVYLGATFDRFNDGIKEYASKIEKKKDEFWIIYVGTIGASYDFLTIIDAVNKLKKEKNINVVFKILGQGPLEDKFKLYVSDNNIDNVQFLGFMDYGKMAAYLSKSDIAINCIKKNASQSIINKVADYFASGIPTLNSCLNEEMMWLIDNFNTGLSYTPEDVNDFIDKFMTLYNDKNLREKMGKNAIKLARDRFDRENSYEEIIKTIDNVKYVAK